MLSLPGCGGGGDSATPATSGGSPERGSGSATVSWLPPIENTDGSAIVNLAGYRIYRGASEGALALVQTVSNPGITTVVLDGLSVGTHYFAVSALTSTGIEGDRSVIGSKTIL